MKRSILLLLLSALIFRIVATYLLALLQFHHLDVEVYKHWTYLLHQWTFREMYSNAPGGWGAHLPLHYYILYPIGFLYRWLGFTPESTGFLPDLLIKLHVFIPEVLIGYIIWLIVKKDHSERKSIIAAALFLFHPAVVYVSVLFAQPDSIIALFALLAMYLLLEKKPLLSALAMASSLLIKPQALSLMPLYAFVLIKVLDAKQLLRAALLGCTYILIAAYPFTIGRSYIWAYEYVKKLADYYLFTSIYALNVWAYEGFMLSDLRTWGGLTLKRWGLLAVYTIQGLMLGIAMLRRVTLTPRLVYLMNILAFYTTYLFATRMSGGRYLLYVFAFYPLIAWNDRHVLISWIITSLIIIINSTHVYNEFNFPLAPFISQSKTVINFLITAHLVSYSLLLYSFYKQVFRKDAERI